MQFYNPAKFDPGGPVVKQDIIWNAFPKELVREYGYERALQEADKLRPLTGFAPQNTGAIMERTLYRPLNEYCEWHVVRDPDTNKIKKVSFTSEPPEFWQALFGETIESDNGSSYKFSGNSDLVVKLYRMLVSPEVRYVGPYCARNARVRTPGVGDISSRPAKVTTIRTISGILRTASCI